jgi:hypothetical protein
VTAGSVPRIDISRLGHGHDLGRGGQGRVTAVGGVLINGRWTAALKTYSGDVVRALDTAALEKIVGFPQAIGVNDRDWLYEHTAWPAVIAEEHGAARGFLMRVVPAEYYFGFRTQTQGTLQKPADVAFLLNSDRYISSSGLSVNDRDRLALLGNIAAALSRLHRLGVVVGDLSPKNLLFRPRGTPGCFIIDCDAMLLQGRTVLPQVQTPDWEVPPGEPIATPATDAYKFGLLAIRLFARDQSSHDRMALTRLSDELGRLAAASQQNRSQRPSPETWIPVLTAAARNLPSAKASVPPAASWPRFTPPGPAPTPGTAAPRPYPPSVVYRPQPPARHPAAKILGTAAVAVLVGIGILTGLHATHSSQGTADSSGQNSVAGQMADVNSLLDSSAASRKSLVVAMADIYHCANVDGAISAIAEVAGQRADEYKKAAALQTAALPRGAALKSDLITALRYSELADKDYLAWARAKRHAHCGNSPSAANSYSQGEAASAIADSAKKTFIRLWNPIASSRGYPARSQAGI